MALPICWPACPTHATNEEAKNPTSCSSRSACNDSEPKQQKVLEKAPKTLAIHLHAFQDVLVFAAALDADADPPVILFNARVENDLREDS